MLRLALAALASILLLPPVAQARDTLVIGIAEFPSSLHPSITVIPQAVPTWLRGFGPNGTGQPFSQQAELWRSEP